MRIPRAMSNSVYARLGGYDRLVPVLDGISGRLMRSERFQTFFRGHNESSKRQLKERFIDFVCEQAGGPVLYTGTDMKNAHAGLQITKDDFSAFCDVVREAASTHKFSADETELLIDLLTKRKDEIIEKSH